MKPSKPAPQKQEPLTFIVNEARRFVHVVYHCQPGFLEWRECMKTLFARPDVGSDFGILVDRREVFHPATTVYIHSLARFIEYEAGKRRWAMVVAGSASLTMARIAHELSKDGSVEVFDNIDDAENWLMKQTKRNP